MTADMMEDWVKNFWRRRPGDLRKSPNILVLDAFLGHQHEESKV
jgi:hypothetical protein